MSNENWENSDIILEKGELGIVSSSNEIKIGDGESHWKDLKFIQSKIDPTPVKNSMNGISSGYLYELSQNLASFIKTSEKIHKLTIDPNEKMKNLNSMLVDVVDTCSGTYISINDDTYAYSRIEQVTYDIIIQKSNIFIKRNFDTTYKVLSISILEKNNGNIVDLISVSSSTVNDKSTLYIANKNGNIYYNEIDNELKSQWKVFSFGRSLKDFFMSKDSSFFVAIDTENNILYGSSFSNYEIAQSNSLVLNTIKEDSLYPIIICETGYCYFKDGIWKYVNPPFTNIKDITIGLYESILVLCSNEYHIGKYNEHTSSYEWTTYTLSDSSIYSCLYHKSFILVGKSGIYVSLKGKEFNHIPFSFKPNNENIIFTKAEIDRDSLTLFLYNKDIIASIHLKESAELEEIETTFVDMEFINSLKQSFEERLSQLEHRISQLEH